MAEPEQITFAKYHALGNDFIVVASLVLERNRGGRRLGSATLNLTSRSSLSRLARSICERHTGIGADGLLVLLPAKDGRHEARVRVFNADGSEAEMSGNGIRCAAAHLFSTSRSPQSMQLETMAGVKTVVLRNWSETRIHHRKTTVLQVDMGRPVLEPAKIPFRSTDSKAPVVAFPLRTPKRTVAVTVTSMGNPHCSVLVNDFETADWMGLGREIERHELFPNRTNVEFVRVISRNEIEVRYWERGVGMTQSSGTGSCAAVVASVLNGLTERNVRVRTLAGDLEVAWGPDDKTTLAGPAEYIAEGTYRFQKS